MLAFIDFETKSTADLKRCGADVYARDKTTDILCFVYAMGDETPQLLKKDCLFLDIFHEDFLEHVKLGGKVVAHNAAFEFAIWNHVCVPKYGWPPLKMEQIICTMVMSYTMALPGTLEGAAAAVGLPHQKDMPGHRVMLQLSQPRSLKNGNTVWWEDEEKFQKLHSYCIQDVLAERDLYKRLLPISEKERQMWLIDQRINERGICVDIESIKTAIEIVKMEQNRLDLEMRKVTDNAVSMCTATGQLTHFLRDQGVDVKSIAKPAVIELLKGDLPENCRKALKLRQEAAKSSTAKLEAMLESVCSDGRMRGLFQYHGAGATGRWAGRRVQLQNLPRPQISQNEIENVFKLLEGAL